MNHRVASALGSTAICLALLGCSHELQIKNLSTYTTTLKLGTVMSKPDIGVIPFSGREDDIFYFNTIVERLSQDPGIGDVRTDYVAAVAERAGFHPDLVVDVKTTVDYRSSGWNFIINWPGFLIFTPAWNGYVYYADVSTNFSFLNSDSQPIDQLSVPMSFSIRHADMDRTSIAELSWFEVSILAFIGGIYNANSFDRDVISPFEARVKDTYANYVLAKAQDRVRYLVDSGALKKPEPPPAAPPVDPSAAPPGPSSAPPTEPAPAPAPQ